MPTREVDLLTEMLRLYSPSGEEAEIAEYLAGELQKNEFDVSVDKAGNVIGTRGSGSPTLLLCGHMDTVPGEIEVKLEGDHLFGRGAVDAKAPLASMIMGASKIHDPNGKIILACLVDEEGQGKGIRQLIADGIQTDYAVFGEPSRTWNVTIGYKGSLHLQLGCKTSTGHSSAPWLSDNAIEKVYEVWREIREKHFQEENIESRFYSVTSCLTKISGGESSSIIPSECNAEIDMRTPPQLSPEVIFGRLKRIVDEFNEEAKDTKIELRCLGSVPAYESDKRSILVRSLTYAIRKFCERAPTLLRKTGTGDMNELGATKDIPIVSYGPGDSHLDHTDKENVSLLEYQEAIKVYQEAIPRLFHLHNYVKSK
ncbi:M20/M25/M40 family metallo-hydrolase [[Eubacterium] cellulosolvens]